MRETFYDTRGCNAVGAHLMSTRDGERSAGPDDDHGFSRKQRPEPVTTHHEYEAKTWHGYIFSVALTALPAWVLHSSIAKQSIAKQEQGCIAFWILQSLVQCLP